MKTNVWGDLVVGKLEKETPEKNYDLEEAELGNGLFVHREGYIFRLDEHGNKEVLKSTDGVVTIRGGGEREFVSVAKAVAENFLPNPAGFKYLRKMDGNKENCHVDNLRWASNRTGGDFARKALDAEKRPWAHRDVFNPEIEIPETITIRSKV